MRGARWVAGQAHSWCLLEEYCYCCSHAPNAIPAGQLTPTAGAKVLMNVSIKEIQLRWKARM